MVRSRRRFSTCRAGGLIAALVLLASNPAALVGQTRLTNDPARGRGLFVGQVVDGATGRPIAGAIVAIFGDNIDWSVMVAGANGQTLVSAKAKGVPEPAPPRQLIADAEGRWAFRGLTKGRYTVHALAPGYLTGGYGQPAATSDGPLPTLPTEQPIELESDDGRIGGLTIRLWKPGVITGIVTDEAGEPAVGIAVRAWRLAAAEGVRQLETVPGLGPGGVSTDDRGSYRIADLAPGDYVVGVLSTPTTIPADAVETYFSQLSSDSKSSLPGQLARSNAPAVAEGGYRVGDLIVLSVGGGSDGGALLRADDGRFLTHPPAFYPAASVPSRATAVAVAAGQERSNIDLRLTLVPAVRVSGVVMGPSGPVPHVGVQLCLADSTEFTRPPSPEIVGSTASDASGRFTLVGVTPGQYVIRVLQVPVWPRTAPGEVEFPPEPTLWAAMRIAVDAADLRDVTVPLQQGMNVTGRLEFDGAREKPIAPELQRFPIQLASGELSVLGTFQAIRISPDGSFSSTGYPPGRYAIRADGRSPWRLRSATVRGRNVLDRGLEIGGEDIADFVLTFTDQPAEIAGRIRALDGTPDAATTVVAFPADSEAWRLGFISSYRVRMSRASSMAAYSLTNLPPGEYFVAALGAEAVGNWKDPGFLAAAARVATRVTIANGEKKAVDLVKRTLR